MQPTLIAQTEMDRLIEAHYRAEIAGDPDTAVAMFVPEIEHDAVGAPMVIHGRAAAAAFYRQLFSGLRFERLTPHRRLYGPDFCVDEARITGHAFGHDGHDRAVRFRLLHNFEFADGLITRENAWLDLAAIQQQLT